MLLSVILECCRLYARVRQVFCSRVERMLVYSISSHDRIVLWLFGETTADMNQQ